LECFDAPFYSMDSRIRAARIFWQHSCLDYQRSSNWAMARRKVIQF
jgi:hypothetical protein